MKDTERDHTFKVFLILKQKKWRNRGHRFSHELFIDNLFFRFCIVSHYTIVQEFREYNDTSRIKRGKYVNYYNQVWLLTLGINERTTGS